ncbi:MAG: hypothetical protein BEN19_00875 [Epulopiscium sp. Nuni2H_MBin003]|nr:MAG: hypothetical protein BEN19_00875 [Epulopiscium sp. Nuni2H_MBin003]
MKQLVEMIAKELVDYPDQVSVEEIHNERDINLILSVASEDIGKVIGKGGKIIKAIRNVVKAGSISKNKKYILEIKE